MIARHRAAAGDAVRAVPLLVRAAESAVGLGARAEAAAYLDMAADLETTGPARSELERRAAEIRQTFVAVAVGGPARGGSYEGVRALREDAAAGD